MKKRIDAATRASQKGVSVLVACKELGIARSSYYQGQKPSPAQLRDEELADKIAEIQKKYFYTIGRRRMGALLQREYGLHVGEARLQRVMSRYGVSALTRQVRKAKPHAGKAYQYQLPDNVLNRQFKADKPFHRMVTDVTYVPYFEDGRWHWGYLSLVQDLFDRSIVAWVFARRQDEHLANRTLQLLSYKPLAPGALLHSDRGCLYTAKSFRALVEAMGLEQSYSRTGNCHDNATMECFNGTFKVEALYNPLFADENPSFLEQNAMIERYINFYNYQRPCSLLGNMTPAAYTESYLMSRQLSGQA